MNRRPESRTRIIDSHTAGEPTRVIVEGGPFLGDGSMAARLQRLRTEHDHWRRALANEPRGHDVLVGAVLCEPEHKTSLCGVIFFNNSGYLGMCGHGTIGLMATLAYLDRIGEGAHFIDTPVGTVTATLHNDGSVSVANVASYRLAKAVALDVPGHGLLHGDIAWAGNWFFLSSDHGLEIKHSQIPRLSALSEAIRSELRRRHITGEGGVEIDHIELLAPPRDPANHGRSYVHCPGGAYDRSPCGTGTSAKLACLAADGELSEGTVWRQESVIDTVFSAHYESSAAGTIFPHIRGQAFVTLDAEVVIDPQDPFTWGLTNT